MALFESESSPRGRRRVFVRSQLPLVIGTGFVITVVALVAPEQLLTPTMVSGLIVIAAASIAAFFFPWERYAPDWLITVAVADIIGVGQIRSALIDILPGAGILAVFPIVWLAYGFRRRMVVLALAGACYITALAFFHRGVLPHTPLEWANAITVPLLFAGVAIVASIAAGQLRQGQQRLREANQAQAKALRQIRDSELLSGAILDTVNAAVGFIDPDLKIVMANKIAREGMAMLDFRVEQPPHAGTTVFAADRATLLPFDQQIIPLALANEHVTDHVEWIGPADQQIAILASSSRVRRDDGELLGTVVVATDITQLAHALNIREEFLRTVSHELRTPLTSMTGYLDLLEDSIDPRSHSARLSFDIVRRNSEKLHDRIGQLLAATDTDAPLHLAPADLGDIVEQAAAAIHPAVPERAQTLIIAPCAAGETALVDAPRLRRALIEVLENAVKFSPPGATITVTRSVRDSVATIVVSDTGPGIERAEQSRIFDRFYRTPFARENAIQGFGLGLTLVKNTVAAHGGRVRVSSEPGRGTDVTITIPQQQAANQAG